MSGRSTEFDPVVTTQKRPPLTVSQILAWADAFHEAHGRWPSTLAGPVAGAPSENWRNIDGLLRHGHRGLPGGSSLRDLLDVHQPGRHKVLTVETILAWADADHAATGQWPTHRTGRILHAPSTETWHGINLALARGLWRLPGGQSLAWLLDEHRQVKPFLSKAGAHARLEMRRRLKAERPDGRGTLAVEQILVCADRYHAATGLWPRARSGPIPGVPGETWKTVDTALMNGRCGLPGGSSLSRLLLEHRGLQTTERIPDLTVEQVLAWADAYEAEHGRRPAVSSGQVAESPRHTWRGIDAMLKVGARGLPGGSSLVRLLEQHRGQKRPKNSPELTLEQILNWADAYHEEHGRWPNGVSGPVAAAPSEKWSNINGILRIGGRGLPGGSSLDRVLAEHRGVRNRTSLPDLSIDQILAWADAHHAATGSWPTTYAGSVEGAPGETWARVDAALKKGTRGVPGGSSLGRLLDERRTRGRLSLEQRTRLTWNTASHAAACSSAHAGTPARGGKDVNK